MATGLPTRVTITSRAEGDPAGVGAPEGRDDVPPELVAAWRDPSARRALEALGIEDGQPEDDD